MIFSWPEQLNRWPCPLPPWSLGWSPLTIRVFTTLQSDPRDLWPLKHLTRGMRRHDMTKKKTMTKTKTKTKTMTKTNTIRERLQRAGPETRDLWDIWSEWWGDMTWPTKKTITETKTMTKTIKMTKIFREDPERATQETCDLWDI